MKISSLLKKNKFSRELLTEITKKYIKKFNKERAKVQLNMVPDLAD